VVDIVRDDDAARAQCGPGCQKLESNVRLCVKAVVDEDVDLFELVA